MVAVDPGLPDHGGPGCVEAAALGPEPAGARLPKPETDKQIRGLVKAFELGVMTTRSG